MAGNHVTRVNDLDNMVLGAMAGKRSIYGNHLSVTDLNRRLTIGAFEHFLMTQTSMTGCNSRTLTPT